MTIESRKRGYHHGDLAQALIDSTVDLLEDKSPTQLSLREVARAAGVSHGAPAHHFGDKAGLFAAVAMQGYELLEIKMHESQAGRTDDRARLRAAGEAYVRFAVQHPVHFSIMFQPNLVHSSEEYLASRARSRAVLEDCVAALLKPTGAEQKRIHATVITLWSQVHGFANLWLTGNLGDPADHALLNQLLSAMLGSLSPRNPQK
ncbi:TetR/AcrR family transcriptional regulator [Parahaliea mediterranea]|uniref:TetR/AcrR family transcriptional regulator n=1 Tax=Parahaliea mediterranea TaxID=651086 RepID=A0A939ILN8_9GAMM|nr:TetR/AcrR family transcriptional regulator [Parahaliea mediterranea]MBN7796173.1 TetR/AcrR family transcriptional regulator [Parahaliea mediterranea]